MSPKSPARYGVVIQARSTSHRLPGKVLLAVEGKPMLARQVERLQARLAEFPVVVATSDQKEDDFIEDLCSQLPVSCFRGPLANVVQRFILCARAHGLTHVIRVGGDDPLIDPDCCLTLVRLHQQEPHDFLYASHRNGWPYGCAAELISLAALEKVRKATGDKHYLEHTIPFFFDHPNQFSILRVPAPEQVRRPDLALTVDYPEDLELVRSIFRALRKEGDYFPLARAIQFLDENPEIRRINHHLHKGFDR